MTKPPQATHRALSPRTHSFHTIYDRAGNIVRGQNASGVWQRFEYDAAGRLMKVQDDSYNDLETYKYGAGRQKLVMTNSSDTFYYVWGGSSIIAEYKLSGGNPMYLKSYIYAGSRLLVTYTRVSAGTQTQESHHPDRLGTKLVTDQYAGTSYQQSTLPFGTAFGAESSGYSNQVFTSYDRSAGTGLDYANNRTYSSGQGRFTQVDPIGMAAASVGDPQSNNRYTYTQNMPTDFVDPSGLLRIQQCTRQWWTGQNGEINYSSWQCTTVYDDGNAGGGSSGGSLQNQVSKDCITTLTDLGVWDKVKQMLDSGISAFVDLDRTLGKRGDNWSYSLGDEPGSQLFGTRAGPTESAYDYFNREPGVLAIRGDAPEGGLTGIYYRSSQGNAQDDLYLRVHELTHLAYPETITKPNIDLDRALFFDIGLKPQKGMNFSQAVSNFFNKKCDPSLKRP